MKHKSKILILALTAIGVGSPSHAYAQATATHEEGESAYALGKELTAKLADNYKDVIMHKRNAESNDILYPAIYSCYVQAMEALPAVEPHSHEYNQIKGILLDLDPDLEAGAYHYSSQGNQNELVKFAQAFLDIQLMDDFASINFKRDEKSFPTITYIAASGAYNKQDFKKAIDYFKLYFAVGGQERREQIFLFMTQACINTQDYALALSTAREGLKQFPSNYNMMMLGVQACVDGGHGESLQEFLGQALAAKPNDEQLLNLQGKLYEDENQYEQALDIYTRLDAIAPQKLSTAKHLALCYYNIGVSHFNDALNLPDEKAAKKARSLGRNYFSAATQKIDEVLGSDPMSVKYLKMQGVSYLCLDEKEKFEGINNQLTALGEDPLSEMYIPPMMTYNDQNTRNFDYQVGSNLASTGEAPLYSEFGKEYVTAGLKKWTEKGEFEKLDDYNRRVNDLTIKAEYERLNKEAQEKYLEQYAHTLRLSELKLMPYDASNETFLVESSYGPITLNVPLKDNEAERFKSNWEGMRFRNPKYFISGDQVQIASITVQTPDGKSYSYDNSNSHNYTQQQVDIDFNSIIGSAHQDVAANGPATTTTKITKKSDVDENIPHTNKVADKTFALIIANENYENVGQVQSALHDGERFAEYCQATLGLPKTNVTLLENATYGKMLGAVNQLKNTVNAFGGAADVIVYYAGHGLPDEATKDAYLLPVDGVPTMLATSYSLDKFYNDLSSMDASSVMVFMDACFSGAKRDGSMLYDARGVAIAHKESAPKGNMLVFSAASGQETALPYAEKNHGLFTYYLLKKLQESKGNVTLKELTDYVTTNVRQQSNIINHKSQTPTVTTSGRMAQEWTTRKMTP